MAVIPRKKPLTRPQIILEKDVYTAALERMVHVFQSFDHVCVAFSGGKDSTATLQVALEAAHSDPAFDRHLPLRVTHYDEEAIPQETADYVARMAARDDVDMEWYCLPVQHRNACSRTSPYWWPWAPEAEDRWCRPLPDTAITQLDGFPINPPEARLSIPDTNHLLTPKRLGSVAMCMGIRAQESLTRRRAVTRRAGGENWLIQDGNNANITKAYPVYDWTVEDVWTAPHKLGWDYNRAYDLMEMAGVSHSLQRCSPAFGEEPLQKLWTYATCFPDVWAKMVDRVPGVGAAGRYALTELYSYHGRPDKPADMTWPEFIMHYFDKFNPSEKVHIRGKLREEIRRHYRLTAHPILPTAPHPDTGIDWSWLLMVAMRGDFKNRKQAGGRIRTLNDGTQRAEASFWHRYADELTRVLADPAEMRACEYPGRRWPDPDKIIPEYARTEI